MRITARSIALKVGAVTAVAAGALVVPLSGLAFASGPTVSIPAGNLTSGSTISVTGSDFPVHSADPTGLQIYECADPQGSANNLPTGPSQCDGTTVSGNQINTDSSGNFSTTYQPSEVNAATGSNIACDPTDFCVLWVGVDFNNGFTTAGQYAFSTPFEVFTAPQITSANCTAFEVGTAGSFTVTTTGDSPPSLSDGGATLPSGVTFVDNGNGTATLAGTPGAGTGGAYTFTITAHNGSSPDATQSFTLDVDQAPAVTSANATTFTVGTNGSFTVTTSGFPAPALSDGGATLPSGVTFHDNGNGTATLAGTPATGTGGTYPIVITANNGVTPNGTQNFTLTVDQKPFFKSATTTTFTKSKTGTFTVTAVGPPTPGKITETGKLPTGIKFSSTGGGTGKLTGKTTKVGTTTITFKATNTLGTTSQTFKLVVKS